MREFVIEADEFGAVAPGGLDRADRRVVLKKTAQGIGQGGLTGAGDTFKDQQTRGTHRGEKGADDGEGVVKMHLRTREIAEAFAEGLEGDVRVFGIFVLAGEDTIGIMAVDGHQHLETRFGELFVRIGGRFGGDFVKLIAELIALLGDVLDLALEGIDGGLKAFFLDFLLRETEVFLHQNDNEPDDARHDQGAKHPENHDEGPSPTVGVGGDEILQRIAHRVPRGDDPLSQGDEEFLDVFPCCCHSRFSFRGLFESRLLMKLR